MTIHVIFYVNNKEMVVPQWRGKKKKRTIPLHTKGYHQKCMADSFSECVIVLNDFCTRLVDIKAGGDPQMPFGSVVLFLYTIFFYG